MKQRTFIKALKAAFPQTIPVLTGYLFIGAAFGVMFQEKGYNVLWAAAMSIIVYAGSGQYLAVNFFAPGFSFLQMMFMTFMVNIRHMFYGLSLLERFSKMGKQRLYMIFSLTDETYSMYFVAKVPKDVDENKFLLAIGLLDQCYWVGGSILGALAGTLIPFNSKGIDFAMTALFLVIFIEQWLSSKQHMPALIGLGGAFLCLLIFGRENFILPAMVCIMILLLSFRKEINKEPEGETEEMEVEVHAD